MWNDDWRTELEEHFYGCYIRLCECGNTRQDLLTMASLMYQYNPTKSKEDCLDRILEWVGDWNSQYEVTDLTKEEYENFLRKM